MPDPTDELTAQLSGKHVLVTGGAGFIGSNLVERLATCGSSVRVFDNFSTGKRANLEAIDAAFEVVEGDLRDSDQVRKACADIDFVLHQGALGSVPRSVEDPKETNDVNVTGTLNVLVAARDAGVKRLVFASSSSVYGDTETLPKSESHVPHPVSPYGVSKLAAEQYCVAFQRVWDIETVCLRYFNVFGPRQDPDSQYAAVVPRFVTAALASEPLHIYGDGEQTRDFTFVENVLNANFRALLAPSAAGEVLNIAGGDRIAVEELATAIGEALGSEPQIVHDSERPGDIRHSYADIQRARAVLDFTVEVGWKKGLQRTVEWFKAGGTKQ